MKKLLSIEGWNRKDQFHFFKQFEEPFFGLTVTVDCTRAYHYAKENNLSFFLCYLYHSLAAANETEPFRYRIENEQVVVYDAVHASPTINRPDGSFGFAYMDYTPTLESFIEAANPEIARVQQSSGLQPANSSENVIHFSSIPWISFTSLSHARCFSFNDSIPKISFGKMTIQNGIHQMPVSVHVHHALMDGFHVARFIDDFQHRLHQC